MVTVFSIISLTMVDLDVLAFLAPVNPFSFVSQLVVYFHIQAKCWQQNYEKDSKQQKTVKIPKQISSQPEKVFYFTRFRNSFRFPKNQ